MNDHNNNLKPINTIHDFIIDEQKKKRGRPKGSKNKPKQNSEDEPIHEQVKVTKESQRPKSTRKAAKRPSDFLFIIKPKPGAKCYYSTEVTVDYTPNRDSNVKSIVPRLNIDNLPYIPGFIMQMDETYYKKHDHRYRDEHQQKIDDYAHPKKVLLQPKPGKRHNYCCVCKQTYDDYLGHITSQNHKKFYNSNEFAKQIKSISSQYNQCSRQQSMKDELNEYTPETQTHVENQDDCQMIPADSSLTHKFQAQKEMLNCENMIQQKSQQLQQQQLFLRNAAIAAAAASTFQTQYPPNPIYRQAAYLDMSSTVRPQQQQQQPTQQQLQPQQQQLQFMGQKTSSISSNNNPAIMKQQQQQPSQVQQTPAQLFYEAHQQFSQTPAAILPTHCIGYAQPAQTMYLPASSQYFLNLAGGVIPQQQNITEQQQQQDMHASSELHHSQIGYKSNNQSQQQQISLNGKRKAEQCVYFNKTLENPRKIPSFQNGIHLQENKMIDLTEEQRQLCIGHPVVDMTPENIFMRLSNPFMM